MQAYSSFIRNSSYFLNKQRKMSQKWMSSNWNDFYTKAILVTFWHVIYASNDTKHVCPSIFSRNSGEMTLLQEIQVILVTSLLWVVIMFLTVAFFVILFALLKLRKNYLKFYLVFTDIWFPLLSWGFRHLRKLSLIFLSNL